MKILHEILIFLEKNFPFLPVSQKKIFYKRPHKVKFFVNKSWLIDMI